MLKAVFSRFGEEIELTDELWQYDFGQKIQVTGIELPDVCEVHFQYDNLTETKTVTGYKQEDALIIDIPNEALTSRGIIKLYIYLVSSEEGRTVNVAIMHVNRRMKPEGFEVPEDIDLFHHTLLAANEYMQQTKNAKKSAETAADQAESARKSAETSADEAKTAKENAETAVKNAEAFKTETETARSEAVRAATESTDAKDSAEKSRAAIAGGYFNASSCTSPNGSKYARVSFPSDETTKARCMFTNIETPDKYYPFGYEYSIITKDVSELKTRKSENRLHGKTMAILGDSMAKGHTLNEKQTWAYKIANRNGMTYQKLAVNGMFITTGHGDADANCLLEQAKKINNNPDIIVIHMGTNDRNNNVELGTWTIRNTDTTNLFGALRVAFTYLEENFPLAQVMFITPYYYQEQTDYIGSIEKACMYVGCHCKNNKQGGICAWNTNVRNALFLDYVHLNEVGQERVSYEYEGFMRTFM